MVTTSPSMGGAEAQVSSASRSGGSDGHLAAKAAGKDAREFGAALVGAHAARVAPVVRLDVVVVVHVHHGDPAKRGPSVMSHDVFRRVLR